jgi:hypothetical protein
MTRDNAESWANAALGLAVSIVIVAVLRAAGLWSTLSPVTIGAVFFVASWARSRALRACFRRMDV